MRSSKNRSRSKGNRNRSVGNIVNRVFDSSGPEGKVRGTPQQIIDKYNQLTRDAQLANDRVAAENFQQHAEHYLRLLGEAQREMDARRDQQQGGGQNQGAGQGSGQNPGQNPGQGSGQGGQPSRNPQTAEAEGSQPEKAEAAEGGSRAFDTVDPTGGSDGDSTLVETPESAPKPRRPRQRRPKKSEDQGGETGKSGDGAKGDEAPKAGGDDPTQQAAE
ncbi:MAG: DUF4167 domain-containing protein [Roseicyclus sp.]